MRSTGREMHSVQRITANRRKLSLSLVIVVLSLQTRVSFADSQLQTATQLDHTSEADSARLSELTPLNVSTETEYGTTSSTQDRQEPKSGRILRSDSNFQHKKQSGNLSEQVKNITGSRKRNEALSTDCFAKRNEVLNRQSQTTPTPARLTTTPTLPPGYQQITPRVEANPSTGTTTASIVLNETLANNFDGEHIPRCTSNGSFEPIQCHQVGYCWCVNKFGQAIKNSAVTSGEEPVCNQSMYESDSDDVLVVTGISNQRVKSLLKTGGSPVESTTPNGHINWEATEPSSEPYEYDNHQQVEVGKRSGSIEPNMPLIPNDCKSSRMNARERALKQVSDSIWVPECDMNDERLYSERQCHKSKVCWCVDQFTGLPLRSGEPLSTRSANSNCTEVKKFLELTSDSVSAFYYGKSEFCDTDKRIEFVTALMNQFRQQISEHVRQNPTGLAPADINSKNPLTISDSQVSKWKFDLMDQNLDGKLVDREWSKFKNNFKLVDKPDELENPFKQQKSPYFSLTPLLILRSQRKCWRDFLDFCGSGELVDESISLTKWLSCTEVPSPSELRNDGHSKRGSVSIPMERARANTREAAIVRSKKKNPFLGILKPD